MGSLDAWAGLAQGIDSGLKNYINLRQVWNQEDRDKKADERAALAESRAIRQEGRQDSLDKIIFDKALFEKKQNEDLHAPVHRVGDILASTGLTSEDLPKIAPYVSQFGIKSLEDKISKTQGKEMIADLQSRDDTKNIIHEAQLRGLEQNVIDAQTAFNATIGPEGTGTSLSYESAKRNLEAAIAQKNANPLAKEDFIRKAKVQEMDLALSKEQRDRAAQALTERKVVVDEAAQKAQSARQISETKESSARTEIARDQLSLAQQTQALSRANDFIKIIGRKVPIVVDMGDGTKQVKMVEEDGAQTLRMAFALNPSLMEKAGVTKPPDEEVDWLKTWKQVDAKLANKENPAQVAMEFKERAKKNGMDFDEKHIKSLLSAYPNLKLILPYFKEKSVVGTAGGGTNVATVNVHPLQTPEQAAALDRVRKADEDRRREAVEAAKKAEEDRVKRQAAFNRARQQQGLGGYRP